MLKDQVQQDYIEAFKGGDRIKSDTLKMVQAGIRNFEIEKRTKLSKEGGEDLEKKSMLNDEEVLEVIAREAKKRKEAIEIYSKEGKVDVAEKEGKELEVLSVYLPEQMSEDEVRVLVEKAIEKTGASEIKEMGKVMGALMPDTKGKADGAMVSGIVKELLNG